MYVTRVQIRSVAVTKEDDDDGGGGGKVAEFRLSSGSSCPPKGVRSPQPSSVRVRPSRSAPPLPVRTHAVVPFKPQYPS